MVNSRLTKKKVERRKRELTIDDFQYDDEWWYVAERENVVANQMMANLDVELMHTNGTTTATTPTLGDEFDIAEDIERK
jgi:nicotinamide mononucleotide adenylyltransferase